MDILKVLLMSCKFMIELSVQKKCNVSKIFVAVLVKHVQMLLIYVQVVYQLII